MVIKKSYPAGNDQWVPENCGEGKPIDLKMYHTDIDYFHWDHRAPLLEQVPDRVAQVFKRYTTKK
jgi:hypothetical protein